MANPVANFFKRPSKITTGKRIGLIVLGIVLFLSLAAFGPVLALHQTALNPDYVAARVVDEIDVSSAAHDWLTKNISPGNIYVAKSIELGIINLEPKIKERLQSVVSSVYGFILERLEKGKLVEMVASQRPLVNDVVNNVQTVLDLPVLAPVIDSSGIDAAAIQKYVNVSQINAYFDALEQLAQARAAFIAVKNSFIPLIIAILLLIIGIVLIARQVIFTTRELGIIFTAYGALQFIGAFIIKGYTSPLLRQYDIPQFLQNALQRLNNNFTSILIAFSLSVLFCGIVLLVVSFIYKPRQLPAHKRG